VRPDLAHLQGSQQAVAQLSNEERVAGLRQERWIEYPRAKRILERLADLVDYPPRDRMPCLVIYGGTGMGKTRIVQKFLRDHRAYFDQKLGRTRLPVLSIQMPPALGATTAQALRQFVEDLLTLLISGLNPNGVNSPRHCSRQDILHILTTLVVNAAPSADPSTRSQRYRRGVTLWSSLLSVLPPHVGAQLEEASRRWPLRPAVAGP
jgi:hypothetical protein